MLDDPTDGYVFFEGNNLCNLRVDINLMRRRMGMVFQQFNLFNNKTVLQNITFAPVQTGLQDLRKTRRKNFLIKFCNLFKSKNKEMPALPAQQTKKQIKEDAKSNAMRLLKRIGLADKADVYPSTLSGGQKQRIAIIRALAMNPKVLLFDEPTSALDPEMVGEVLSLIKELATEGMTMVIVTHEIAFAREVATRVLFMADGKYASRASQNRYLTPPKANALKTFYPKCFNYYGAPLIRGAVVYLLLFIKSLRVFNFKTMFSISFMIIPLLTLKPYLILLRHFSHVACFNTVSFFSSQCPQSVLK